MVKFLSKKNDGISLKLFVATVIIIVCAASIGVYALISEKVYYAQYKKDIIDDVDKHTDIIARILLDNYVSGAQTDDAKDEEAESDTETDADKITDTEASGVSTDDNQYSDMDSDIELLASVYEGRIILIDSNYRIIKDSLGERNGEYIISEAFMEAMRGNENRYIEDRTGYIRYIRRIENKNGEIAGLIVVHISRNKLDKINNAVIPKLVVVFLVIFVLCVVLAYYISAFSVRDLRYINNQMDIAQNGHLDEPIKEKGFMEFRNLIGNYNETIEKLADIDSSRQEFVSNVSHELKTPITSMKVLADSLVQNENADLDMYKEFMSDIVDEIDRESKIITDLLTLVKMDKKSAEMNVEEVSINNLLDIILKRVIPIANQRNIEITYESYRDVVADVDEVKLSLALSNIIENAVKYNIDNGWVKVTLNSDHKFFYVKVADSGVGIPDDCKSLVFERFYRVDKARSRDTGGTGLGLAITKNVISMHNGTIKLYSESGEGTTFTIKIALKRSQVN